MPDPDRLRERYRSLSDEALLAAHAKGEGHYITVAWDIVTSEVTSRGLRPAAPRPGRHASPLESGELAPAMRALLDYGRTPVNVVLPTDSFARLPVAHQERTDAEPSSDPREVQYGAPAEVVPPVGSGVDAPWALHPALEARRQHAIRAGKGRIVWGAIALALGLLVTVGTYASSADSGGTYVFAWGAIVYGIFQMIRGRVAMDTGMHDV